MGVEIEHKYLVSNDSYKSMATEAIEIVQGYLNRDPMRTVRVRIFGPDAYITIKSKNEGDTRLEFEYQIPVNEAREILKLAEGTPIRKIRYIVPYEGNIWEVDEFLERKDNLVIAEIEIPTSDHKYKLPPFVGKNVTGDKRYYNSNLNSGDSTD